MVQTTLQHVNILLFVLCQMGWLDVNNALFPVFSCVSILGMHLFGCKFGSERDGDTLPDRKNFDSLLWAIVTVFQVSTPLPLSLLNIYISLCYGQFSCSFMRDFTVC